MPTSIPIACTLDAGDYAERVRWIAALNRDALLGCHCDGLTLELRYHPRVADRVRALVRREQQCCAFLAFDVAGTPDAIVLRVTAPPETRDAIDALFAPFLATSDEAASAEHVRGACEVGCGCGPVARDGSGRAAGIAATSSAVAALACGVCCVVPFALPAAALASFGAAVTVTARAYWWALGAAAAAVVAGDNLARRGGR